MRIEIHREAYINNPCPKIAKEVFDYFWRNLYRFRFERFVTEIKHLKIVINQACPGMPLHFYVTLNGEHDFHMTSELYDSQARDWSLLCGAPFSEVSNESPWSRKSGVKYYKNLIKRIKNEIQ